MAVPAAAAAAAAALLPGASYPGVRRVDLDTPLKWMPGVAALAILCTAFMAPVVFPALHMRLLAVSIMISMTFSLRFHISYLFAISNVRRTISSAKSVQDVDRKLRFFHAIIIPNYAEPICILEETIARLTSHPFAKSNFYLILAMEASEADHAEKSACLVKRFRPHFKDIFVSVHPQGIPGEHKGKGSNVNWAARAFHDFCLAKSLQAEDILFTITDSDGSFSPYYFDVLDSKHSENMQNILEFPKKVDESKNASSSRTVLTAPWSFIYAPPIFFGKNINDVPLFVRVNDLVWAIAVTQSMASIFDFGFPSSTYSLPLTLARDIGWWDCGIDAIGEEIHMLVKCYYGTNTRISFCPIWVPVNLTNVQGDTYLSSLFARYIQGRRHLMGSVDSLYCWRSVFAANSKPVNSKTRFRQIYVLLRVIEAHYTSLLAVASLVFIPAACLLNPDYFYASDFYAFIDICTKLISLNLMFLSITHSFYFSMIWKSKIFDPPCFPRQLPITARKEISNSTTERDENEADDLQNQQKQVENPFHDIKFTPTAFRSWYQFVEIFAIQISLVLFTIIPVLSLSQNFFSEVFRMKKNEFVYVVAQKQKKL